MSRRFGDFLEGREDVELKQLDAHRKATAATDSLNDDDTLRLQTEAASLKHMPTLDEMPSTVVSSGSYSESFTSFCKYFIPVVVSIVSLIVVFMVVSSAGGIGTEGGSAKAVIIVFEGFAGTAFNDLVLERGTLPNLQALAKRGTASKCATTGSDGCAVTQGGPSQGKAYTYQAAPGITSILTGVNAARHGVYNNSPTAIKAFASSAAKYPSIAKRVKDNGGRVVAIGGPLLLTTLSDVGECTSLGVLDFECGTDSAQRCLQSSTCNVDQRILIGGTSQDGLQENLIAQSVQEAFDTATPDLLILHFSALAKGAEDPTQTNFSYSSSSMDYAAEAYLLDAVVGQVFALLKTRASTMHENWLLAVTSAHGGKGKLVAGTNPEDAIVPFLMSPITASGNLGLKEPSYVTSQMDVAPTLMQWFGFDATADTTTTSKYDGKVQCICSDGINPRNCTDGQ